MFLGYPVFFCVCVRNVVNSFFFLFFSLSALLSQYTKTEEEIQEAERREASASEPEHLSVRKKKDATALCTLLTAISQVNHPYVLSTYTVGVCMHAMPSLI